MPGITGIISNKLNQPCRSLVEAMVDGMVNEPFSRSGTYINDQLGWGVGWTCHEGSFSDCLPVWNESGDICLIFSGENFAEAADINWLKGRSHRFDAEKAEYIVHWYEELGVDVLEKLNGWFSGVLIDLRQERLILFNDRYGLDRIYYRENSQGFFFASEAKALLRVLPETRGLDLESLGEVFSCGCVLQNRSLFPGVFLLPGASRWSFSPAGKGRKESYFRKEDWENLPLLSAVEFSEQLGERFAALLPKYLRGSQQIGVSMTGGVDSRMIMAWIRSREGRLPCYTFGSPYRESKDVQVARKVAKLCHQSHQVIRLDKDFIAEFPALAEKTVYITDGAMDVSGAADLFVNRVARSIGPVRLTGNYGGEILRRIVAFKPFSLDAGIFEPSFLSHVRAASDTYGREKQTHRLSFVAFKQVPWHHYSRLTLERSQLTLRSPYLDNALVSLAYQAPPELALSKEPSLRLVADGNPILARLGTDRGLLRRPIPLITNLAHFYQEFTFKAEYAYDYGMPHWLARADHHFQPLHLERLFLGRHKFHHFRVWYRDHLGGYLRDTLLNSHTLSRPYFNGGRIKQIVENHLNGTHNYTQEIHRLLTVELIQRELIEQRPGDKATKNKHALSSSRELELNT